MSVKGKLRELCRAQQVLSDYNGLSVNGVSQGEYRVLMHPDAFGRAREYLEHLRVRGTGEAGGRLRAELGSGDLARMDPVTFIERLVATKRPRIFAESEVRGDGADWNLRELSILGDIGFAVPVRVFDDGRHRNPSIHAAPFPATLLFVAGALLRSRGPVEPADWKEATHEGRIDPAGYERLYERRLLPSLIYRRSASRC